MLYRKTEDNERSEGRGYIRSESVAHKFSFSIILSELVVECQHVIVSLLSSVRQSIIVI